MNAWCPPTSEPIASRESSSGRQGFSFENHFVVAIAGEANGKVVAADGPLVAAARVLLVLQYGIMVLEGRKVVREPVDILPVHCADLVKSRFLRLVLVNGEDLLSVFLHEGIEDRLDRDRVLGQPEAIGHAGFGMGFEEISNYSRNKQLFLKREFYFRNFYFFFLDFGIIYGGGEKARRRIMIPRRRVKKAAGGEIVRLCSAKAGWLHWKRLKRKVCRLQRWWRKMASSGRSTYHIVEHNAEFGATRGIAKMIGKHKEIVEFLRLEWVMEATCVVLERVYRLCVRKYRKLVGRRLMFRMFMNAFQLAEFPEDMFEATRGDLEERLFQTACDMLDSFEGITQYILQHYRFSDVPRVLTESFVPLLARYQDLYYEWEGEFGPRNTLHKAKEKLLNLYRRQAMSGWSFDSKTRDEFKEAIEMMRKQVRENGGEEALGKIDVIRERMEEALPKDMDDEKRTGRLDGVGLIQRLVVNPTYRGEVKVQDEGAVFWKALEVDLEISGFYDPTLVVLERLHGSLMNLSRTEGERCMVSEILDLRFIKDQVKKGLYTWSSVRGLVGGMVRILESIGRKQLDGWGEIARSLEAASGGSDHDRASSFCRALKFIVDSQKRLGNDEFNTHIEKFLLMGRESLVEYVAGKFHEEEGLANTHAWISGVLKKKDDGSVDKIIEGKASSYVALHLEAMIELVVREEPLEAERIPETLRLDFEELASMQGEIGLIGCSAAMLSFLPKLDAVSRKEVSEAVVASTSAVELACKMEDKLAQITEDVRRRTLKFLEECVQKKDHLVRKLMAKRVRKVLSDMMRTGAPEPGTPSLEHLQVRRIEQVALKLTRITNANRSVHLERYNKLFKEVAVALRSSSRGQ